MFETEHTVSQKLSRHGSMELEMKWSSPQQETGYNP